MKRMYPIEDYERDLRQLADMAHAHDARVMFAPEYILEAERDESSSIGTTARLFESHMKAIALEKEASFCDVRTGLARAYPDPAGLFFSWDQYHLSSAGTGALAQRMLECLDESRLAARQVN